MTDFFDQYFRDLSKIVSLVDNRKLEAAVDEVLSVRKSGKKVIIAGNGGSASIASHVSIDLTKAAGVRAVCFNESSLITCFANDYGYENWVKKAIINYADIGDLVILISSSGESANILNAAKQAKKIGLKLITFSGFSAENSLRSSGDLNFWCDSEVYNHIENTHQIWLLSMVDKIVSDLGA